MVFGLHFGRQIAKGVDCDCRIDQGEKKDAYFTIPTLHDYWLIEQNCPAVSVYRRTDQGIVQETYMELTTVVPVEFVPEPEEEEI